MGAAEVIPAEIFPETACFGCVVASCLQAYLVHSNPPLLRLRDITCGFTRSIACHPAPPSPGLLYPLAFHPHPRATPKSSCADRRWTDRGRMEFVLLFFALDFFPPSHWADTSFRCRYENPECHRFWHPSPFFGFFQRLLRVQSAPVQQIERAPHFVAQGRAESRPPKPNNIECGNAVLADCDRKRRNIFSDSGVSLQK
jgi:hypothetical protein